MSLRPFTIARLRSFLSRELSHIDDRARNMRRIIVFENFEGTKGILKHLSHIRAVKRIEGACAKNESIADLNWVGGNAVSWSTKPLCSIKDAIFNGFPLSPMDAGIDFVSADF